MTFFRPSTVVSSQSSQRVHCAELGKNTVFATVTDKKLTNTRRVALVIMLPS